MNKDGFVTKDEMLKLCKNLNKQQVRHFHLNTTDITSDNRINTRVVALQHYKSTFYPQVDALFERKDKNHDNKLSRKEFADFMNDRGKK